MNTRMAVTVEQTASLPAAVDSLRRFVTEKTSVRATQAFHNFTEACEREALGELHVPEEYLAATVDRTVRALWGMIRSEDFPTEWVVKQIRADLRFQFGVFKGENTGVVSTNRTTLVKEEQHYHDRKVNSFDELVKETSATLQRAKKSKRHPIRRWLKRIVSFFFVRRPRERVLH